MARDPHFNLGISSYSDEQLDNKINLIAENMTGNPNYTNVGTKVTDMVDSQASYNVIKGKKGTVLNFKQIKKTGRKDLVDTMVVLGEYARDKWPLDVTKWKTTGFTIQVYDGVVAIPVTPTNLKAKDAMEYSQVVISYKKVAFATLFEGRHWLKGTAAPVDITNSSKNLKMLFKRLIQGKPYNF